MSLTSNDATAAETDPGTTGAGGARTAGRPRLRALSREATASAVVDLICEHGFNGWSMRNLADRLGVSLGTLTHHYRDKQELLIEAMDSVYVLPADWDRYRRLSPTDQLLRMVDTFIVDSPGRRRGWRFWIEYMAGVGHNAALIERHEERYERQRRFFARVIVAGMSGDDFALDLDPELEAARLLGLGNGLAIQQLVTPDHLAPGDARRILESYVRGLARH